MPGCYWSSLTEQILVIAPLDSTLITQYGSCVQLAIKEPHRYDIILVLEDILSKTSPACLLKTLEFTRFNFCLLSSSLVRQFVDVVMRFKYKIDTLYFIDMSPGSANFIATLFGETSLESTSSMILSFAMVLIDYGGLRVEKVVWPYTHKPYDIWNSTSFVGKRMIIRRPVTVVDGSADAIVVDVIVPRVISFES